MSRVVICEKCSKEIIVREGILAYETFNRHLKDCK